MKIRTQIKAATTSPITTKILAACPRQANLPIRTKMKQSPMQIRHAREMVQKNTPVRANSRQHLQLEAGSLLTLFLYPRINMESVALQACTTQDIRAAKQNMYIVLKTSTSATHAFGSTKADACSGKVIPTAQVEIPAKKALSHRT